MPPSSRKPARARNGPPTEARPTRQARSARTLARLLDAAETLLSTEGLEGTTVPAIARRAGVSVGAVYRRFPDKDALLRRVYVRFFQARLEVNRVALDPAHWLAVPPEAIARAVIGGMVAGYRQKSRLLRALILYAQTHPDPDFRRRSDRFNLETMALIETLLLRHRDRIAHPAPTTAVRFGLLIIAFLLRGMLFVEGERFRAFMPPPEEETAELVRMYLGYLGLGPEPEPPAPGAAARRRSPRRRVKRAAKRSRAR